LTNRAYLYVKAFSDLGSRMDAIALGVVIYATTGSAAWLSALLGVSMLGGLISSLFSGVLADRLDRRGIMIITDWLRAVLIISLIFFPNPIMILVIRFLMGLMSSFFEVSFMAEVPQIYGNTNLLRVNAMLSRLSSISMVIGFLAGGMLYDFLGFESVLLIDGCTFAISAIVLMRMKWNHTHVAEGKTFKQPLRQLVSDMREVKTYLWGRPILLLIFLVFLFDTFGSASHNLGVPLLAEQIDVNKQALYYGLIWSVWAFGNVITTYFLPKLAFVKQYMYRTYFISTVLMSVGFIAIFSTTYLPVVLIFAFLTGLTDACAMTTNSTIMQQCDNQIRGRILGISSLLGKLGFGVGFVVAPMLITLFSLSQMVIILHSSVIIVTIIAAILYLKQSKGVSQYGSSNTYDERAN